MKPKSLKIRLTSSLVGLLVSASVLAAGQVSSITLLEQPATPFSYTVDGVEYNWGRGNNQLIEGFTSGGRGFGYIMAADEVVVQRDDITGVASGAPCGIFVERLQQRDYAADFPLDSSSGGNCRLESLLESRIINRGLVDTFSNKQPDAKNIERLDYLFHFGALAPIAEDNLRLAGHLVAEKQGNNPVKIAAIMALDVFGQPSEYGPLVLVSAAGCSGNELCYGATDLVHDYTFLQNEFNAPQGLPVETERTREVVNMAFVSAADLGLAAGQRYFGFSLFADDVDEQFHDLVDPRTFPNDTSDDYIVPGDDADIYGGLTGYFASDDIVSASGDVFLDVDLDGVRDGDEAGLSDITITLYSDTNGNGMLDPAVDVQMGDSSSSSIDGSFVFPGLADGNYLVILDSTDPEIPEGLVVAPGINPHPMIVGGSDPGPVSFAFISASGTGSGSGSDGLDDGTNGGSGDGSDGGSGDGANGGSGDGTDGGSGDGTDGGSGDGSDGGSGDGADGGSGDGSDGGSGDGTDGGSGDGSDGGSGDGSDGGSGDGSDGGSGDGTDGGPGDGSDGGSGDGTDGGSGDGSDGGSGDGSDGGSGDGSDGGSGDGSDGGSGDGSDGGSGDGSDGGSGDGSDGGSDDGAGNGDPLADAATAAVSDVFEVNQGQTAFLDVLANDVDGTNANSLTLLSVTQSANATISITDDNEVLFIPDPGYYSAENQPDTFTYTMEDGDGDRRTGNVSVTVIRFSDLNNNNLNDFVECNCTELLLETGVNGSGVGQVSRWLMLALLLFCIWRLPLRRIRVAALQTGGQ